MKLESLWQLIRDHQLTRHYSLSIRSGKITLSYSPAKTTLVDLQHMQWLIQEEFGEAEEAAVVFDNTRDSSSSEETTAQTPLLASEVQQALKNELSWSSACSVGTTRPGAATIFYRGDLVTKQDLAGLKNRMYQLFGQRSLTIDYQIKAGPTGDEQLQQMYE